MSKATNKAKQQARVKPKKHKPRYKGRRNPASAMRFDRPLEENAKLYAITRMMQVALDVFGLQVGPLQGAIMRPEGLESDCLPGAD